MASQLVQNMLYLIALKRTKTIKLLRLNIVDNFFSKQLYTVKKLNHQMLLTQLKLSTNGINRFIFNESSQEI